VRGRLPVLLLGALTFLFLAGLFSGEISDPDCWWHLKTGKYIAEHLYLSPDRLSGVVLLRALTVPSLRKGALRRS
jgi:hypothetical protein